MSTGKRPTRFKRFLAGKGFYAALALCLLVICGVALAAFSDSIGILKKKDTPTEPSKDQGVAEPITSVPDNRTTTTKVTTTAPTTAKTTATPASVKPLFVLPGSNEVAKGFSDKTPVYSATMGDWRVHSGADFVGNEGMTVKAIADGTVRTVSEDTAMGETIVIDHGNGVQSKYCGVTAAVKVGDAVKAADAIGTLSGVPCESADGCHLHLEITVNSTFADPVKTIGREVKYREQK